MKRKFNYVPAGLVAFASFLAYLPALGNGFVGVWDDNAYIAGNPHIRSLDAAFFRWALFDFHASNWHPLTWLSHALDYAIWGLNPWGHHLTSNILHALNTFLVVLLVVRLLEAGRKLTHNKISPNPSRDHNSPFPPLILRGGADLPGRSAEAEGGGVIPKRGTSAPPPLEKGDGGGFSDTSVLIAAATTGLLFGLHPVHVESVAWVSERKDLLCALFYLLSIMAYTKYVCRGGPLWPPKEGQPQGVAPTKKDPGSPGIEYGQAGMTKPRQFLNRQYLLALGFFILALLSKPMAVSLPLVLLILDWYPFGRLRSFGDLLTAGVEKIPFVVLSLFSSIVTILAQRSGESIGSLQLIPLSVRIPVAAESLIAYLRKMLLPVDLVPLYPYPQDVSLISFRYAAAIALVLGITLACLHLKKEQRFWLAAWGSYVVMLIPVLGIVKVGNLAMADRYTYLPSIGPFLIAGLCMAWIAGKVSALQRRRILAGLACSAGALLIFVALSYGTFLQTGIWKNAFVLWDHAIAKGFGSATAYNNRGLSLDDMGQRDKAREDFEKAIALDPQNYFAYNNLGVLCGKDRQYQKSIKYFLKAIAINPRHADSYCNLGLSYFYLNQYGSALENYTRAIELKKDFDMAYLNRGNLYFITGNKEPALADYRKACALGNRNACYLLRLATGE